MSKSQSGRASRLFRPVVALFVIALAGCATVPEPVIPPACPVTSCPACPVCPAPVPVPPPPAAKPLQPADWSDLPGWAGDDLGAALPAFRRSCRALLGRAQAALWRPACEAAEKVDGSKRGAVRQFFETQFSPYRMTNPDGSTQGTITGYYEPLLKGSRQRTSTYGQAVLGVPGDLLQIDLTAVAPELKNLRLRGRLQGNKVIPYYSRAEIVAREADYASDVLLWVDDPVELFFLQIQGSGRVRLPDGSLVRLGYADQNGHPFQAIGRILVERGELKLEQASMQGIQSWARAHPREVDALLNENPSFVFFREMPAPANPDDGPIGALGVPLTPERSIAVDPRHVPLGAPIFLATTQPASAQPLRRLMLAQDTGGAIRGVVRADFFWGFGAKAGSLAGRMKQAGEMWVLLPPGIADR